MADAFNPWRRLYHKLLRQQPASEMDAASQRLKRYNLATPLSQPAIASIWQAIEQADDWQPFFEAIASLKQFC